MYRLTQKKWTHLQPQSNATRSKINPFERFKYQKNCADSAFFWCLKCSKVEFLDRVTLLWGCKWIPFFGVTWYVGCVYKLCNVLVCSICVWHKSKGFLQTSPVNRSRFKLELWRVLCFNGIWNAFKKKYERFADSRGCLWKSRLSYQSTLSKKLRAMKTKIMHYFWCKIDQWINFYIITKLKSLFSD